MPKVQKIQIPHRKRNIREQKIQIQHRRRNTKVQKIQIQHRWPGSALLWPASPTWSTFPPKSRFQFCFSPLLRLVAHVDKGHQYIVLTKPPICYLDKNLGCQEIHLHWHTYSQIDCHHIKRIRFTGNWRAHNNCHKTLALNTKIRVVFCKRCL